MVRSRSTSNRRRKASKEKRTASTSQDQPSNTAAILTGKLEFIFFVFYCCFLASGSDFYYNSIPIFNSGSSSATQTKCSAECSEPRKSARIQRTLLECGYNPRFSLDEEDFPPAFVPQVLLEDNFDELVNAVDSRNRVSPSGKRADTAGDIQIGTADKGDAPEVTEVTDVPISEIPAGLSTPPDAAFSKFVHCKDKDSPTTQTGNTPVSAKGSPFTRYLIKKTDPPKEQGENDTCAVTSEPKSPENSDPQDTGATRLERLLAEAAEEAANKQIQLNSNLMVSESAETNERGGLEGRPVTEAITATNPPDVVGDNYQPSD